MTNKENIREKLVDSMRKTTSTAKDAPGSKPGASAGIRKKKATSKSRPGPASPSRSRKKKGVASSVSAADPFQSGRRVWPD